LGLGKPGSFITVLLLRDWFNHFLEEQKHGMMELVSATAMYQCINTHTPSMAKEKRKDHRRLAKEVS